MSSELIAIRPVKECWVCAKHCAKNFVWSVTNPLRHPPDKRTLNSYALLSHLHFTKENALQHLLSLLFWTRKCMRKHSVLSKIIYISEILVKLYIHPYNMLGVHKQLWLWHTKIFTKKSPQLHLILIYVIWCLLSLCLLVFANITTISIFLMGGVVLKGT